jgi:hypothetical protein
LTIGVLTFLLWLIVPVSLECDLDHPCYNFFINKDRTKITLNRTQLPLTHAYTFTDYRLQGQMLESVIVDITSPLYGHLTPFNMYVPLLRGTGRDAIQLL